MWLSPRALGLHVALLVCVPGFLWLGWWQLHRALAGNGLSWAYTFEWPFFCVYAAFMWWKLVHDVGADRAERDASRSAATNGPTEDAATPTPPDAAGGDAYDEELSAYNRYLTALNDTGERKHW
ncbi:MAG: hypothetical protein JWO62_3170 [Acidimicrobiaceae bacterium]|jgi:hypothetical protein|nr:hypothetical protein [Acidimicrobiaceae bacterium]